MQEKRRKESEREGVDKASFEPAGACDDGGR